MRVTAGPRLLFIDNLRWTMIVLVVAMHAACTYSPFGIWYFHDRAGTGRAAVMVLGTFQAVLQSFFMALLFAVAGYFSSDALQRKPTAQFLRERLFRLGAPLLFYMLVLGPFTEYVVAGSWRHRAGGLPEAWLVHVEDGTILSESGPLWFCAALLAFSCAYAAMRRPRPAAVPAPSLARILGFIALMAIATFAARLVWRDGTSVLNMQLADFAQYILMFGAGTVAHRGSWLHRLDGRAGRAWLGTALVGGLAAWVGLVWAGMATHTMQWFPGGWHWLAACRAIWESFMCVAISLGLVTVFRDHANRQGPVARFLSANAFAVYVLHPPVLIAVTRMLVDVNLAVLAKVAVATFAGGLLSFLLAAPLARRLPGLRAML